MVFSTKEKKRQKRRMDSVVHKFLKRAAEKIADTSKQQQIEVDIINRSKNVVHLFFRKEPSRVIVTFEWDASVQISAKRTFSCLVTFVTS
jgi:REP element-mobilizing transposase RayT